MVKQALDLTKNDIELLRNFLEYKNCKIVTCGRCPIRKIGYEGNICYVRPNGIWGDSFWGEDGRIASKRRLELIEQFLGQLDPQFEF